MKYLILFLFIPLSLFSQKQDSTLIKLNNRLIQIEKNDNEIVGLKKEILELNSKYDYQVKVNEQTLTSISNQIGASSFNLSIFGILFGIVAIGLGIYVTYIERKIVNIRTENEKLLSESLKIKNEVMGINNQIQDDIYGLFKKIKREETTHILQRLLKVPKDISNLGQQLLSRELLQEDFSVLKKAYLKLKTQTQEGYNYNTDYEIIMFQHFLDELVRDEEIGSEFIDSYPHSIYCAFDNDIIKSTEDFIKAIVDIGYQKKGLEINSFIKGLSNSEHKDFNKVYNILFDGLKNRNDQFKFYDNISSEKANRIGKSNFGKLLKKKYSDTELSNSEKLSLEELDEIILELENEETQRKQAEEKRKLAVIEKKKKLEEKLKAQKNKK
jgi:hypothetical protein